MVYDLRVRLVVHAYNGLKVSYLTYVVYTNLFCMLQTITVKSEQNISLYFENNLLSYT